MYFLATSLLPKVKNLKFPEEECLYSDCLISSSLRKSSNSSVKASTNSFHSAILSGNDLHIPSTLLPPLQSL